MLCCFRHTLVRQGLGTLSWTRRGRLLSKIGTLSNWRGEAREVAAKQERSRSIFTGSRRNCASDEKLVGLNMPESCSSFYRRDFWEAGTRACPGFQPGVHLHRRLHGHKKAIKTSAPVQKTGKRETKLRASIFFHSTHKYQT